MIVGDLLGLRKEEALNATERDSSRSLRDRIKTNREAAAGGITRIGAPARSVGSMGKSVRTTE
jgi:hypothetical protein